MRRPNKQSRNIIPWGWNHCLKKRLINEGVDQIICQTGSPIFIPVSEINLRMTMGLIARNQLLR